MPVIDAERAIGPGDRTGEHRNPFRAIGKIAHAKTAEVEQMPIGFTIRRRQLVTTRQ